jgi:hypothetical protein
MSAPLSSVDAARILHGRRPVETAVRGVLTDALQRMRREGMGTDMAVEILLQSQLNVLVLSVQQLVLAGPARLRASEAMLDMLARALDVPRETISAGEMLR